MNTIIGIALAICVSIVQTVHDVDSQKQVNAPTNEVTQNTELQKLKKDPLYPFIDKQNQTKVENGITYIENEDNLLILANKKYSMQPTYAPADLVVPDVAFSFGDTSIEKAHMRKEAAEGLSKMFQGAKEAGYDLYAVSGYRSYKRQQEVFQAEVNAKGDAKAREAVAYPGTSEHQTGLAMDISSKSADFNLSEGFGATPEGKWAKENAHQYGFILRYPAGKEAITEYQYESWHFRYVGVDAAKIIYENNWTLEEFFDHVEALDKEVQAASAK
ncbi:MULTISPECIES: D-alanyl-D-alanine carboxypeptidase family protein [Listeria]|uniref:M15 family metallopeptidase n=1 Tax=Listeria TaxID=1637 RepID=UPI000B58E66E|nr:MULTISPECIES: D-alanyl-D-alanine carboxypeptidase family protein [Listeria]